MSNSYHTNDTLAMAGLVEQNHELLNRIEGDIKRDEWIGTQVLRPYAESASMPETTYTGPNRRGMFPVTVRQIARRLEVKSSDIVFLAKRNYIPGAYEVDGEWFFDGRHLRIWYDDFQKGVVSLPH